MKMLAILKSVNEISINVFVSRNQKIFNKSVDSADHFKQRLEPRNTVFYDIF